MLTAQSGVFPVDTGLVFEGKLIFRRIFIFVKMQRNWDFKLMSCPLPRRFMRVPWSTHWI
jgi:hypothetical protein